jgi:hypothetical protein
LKYSKFQDSVAETSAGKEKKEKEKENPSPDFSGDVCARITLGERIHVHDSPSSGVKS